ncbi:hypothetical protein C4D60_Mb01t12640 [Musa balbisiana]|uniref:Sm domain-containing protein n=1 Tax=Musa balbisiana TaxID=52838 RepID=A0A4V4H7B5_MUSBA|nr:hypothetical protein C4D60_Mb01t12640 [Musa balbisiana]
MSRSLGLPVKHLHETARQVVRVELKSGVLYRGIMIECEDNWNCQLGNIICTAKVVAVIITACATIISGSKAATRTVGQWNRGMHSAHRSCTGRWSWCGEST